ncbi:hypothetical protein QJ043_02165 [Olsenella sp. YH-ols2217]|uniref:Uncharacterized protein n=1 Tax=Kribbibacterium absianum TaxID=3044210 RepID=A0ABT6ZIK6_9ACTN|nr:MULTISPECIES: hypothetical protein [unclassified Olsenella]MDJ1121397.1 hypothetical protein [Olsenella sp. YH-ols2216]MDJ1128887.1 hypothetical protein [Olsenella sp. YH-ols2217]
MTSTTRRGFLAAGVVALGATAWSLGAAFAATTGHVSEARAQVDTVDIRAVAQGVPAGTDTVFDDATAPSNVLVENLGATCWVRGRTWLSEEGREPVSSEYRPPVGAPWWRAADGWTYLVEPLGDGASVVWSEEAYEPLEWRGGQRRELVLDVEFEAVQAEHFVQDLAADAPWGDVEPETCVHARAGAAEGTTGSLEDEAAGTGDRLDADDNAGEAGKEGDHDQRAAS